MSITLTSLFLLNSQYLQDPDEEVAEMSMKKHRDSEVT